ncbi:IclR family transcriptional regulator [Advenella sp. WQ 585]|uniref:IclR family transcriptional regulator n=1 Tax=Advenella mandrilli TaxID=2800330 RepID=A0ABS1EET2_9BURK|nr:IclR family transcriptional regulator [Advenella mandrilli]MBK1780115.1 IclR family transcriptional regulator [Advenella mandrilli]
MKTAEKPQTTPDRRQRVQAAETGFAVLKGLARMGGSASLTALASHVNENPAKVHRYLASLIEEELVIQDPESQQYRLSMEAMFIGLSAMRQSDPIRLGEPALIRLRENLEVTCFIAVMGNKGPVIVRFEEPSLPVTVNVRVGSVLPLLTSATGRVFLGLQNDRQVKQLAQEEMEKAAISPNTEKISDLDGFITQLRDEVQKRHCAIVKDTNLRGISAVAAPVYNYAGQLCAVITALGATGGFDASVNGEISHQVQEEARLVSAELGYVGAV